MRLGIVYSKIESSKANRQEKSEERLIKSRRDEVGAPPPSTLTTFRSAAVGGAGQRTLLHGTQRKTRAKSPLLPVDDVTAWMPAVSNQSLAIVLSA